MKSMLLAATIATAALGFGASGAEARFSPQGIDAGSLVEQAQCVMRRERVVRPGGVVFRTVRSCRPMARPMVRDCRTVRERIVRPGGRVIVRTVRRCG